ncbi:MAG: hypothetical protein ACM3UY_10090 [Methanocella sp.]
MVFYGCNQGAGVVVGGVAFASFGDAEFRMLKDPRIVGEVSEVIDF